MKITEYRVWDKVAKKMTYKDIQIVQTDWGKGFGVYVNLMNFEDLEGKNGNRFILLEWIGQKDKNGEKIYEGDVLIDDNYPEDGIDYAEVKWVERNDYIGWSAYPWGSEKEYFTDYQVIGNVFENPELKKLVTR